ncbi:unnamed protein product, partial [Symbiodinium microadriaticum]
TTSTPPLWRFEQAAQQRPSAEALEVVLDQGCPLATFPKITSLMKEQKPSRLPLPTSLHPKNFAAAMQLLSSNRLYRPAPKSSSADLFIKQQDLIIELQDKSGVSVGVSFFDACQEVEKCIQAKDTCRLEVRKGLELVIPHPEHVKAFLGDDFEIVKKLAERRKEDAPGGMITIPFLSRFYNFASPHVQGWLGTLSCTC